MKGAAAGQPGQVVLVEFPEPAPQAGEVVLAVSACGVCATDVKMVQKGSRETRYALGHELAGRVLQAPPDGDWQVGQRVAVAPYLPCGQCFYCSHDQPALCTSLYAISILPGGLAERVLVPAELVRRGLFALPDSLSDEAAALAEPLGCVLKGLTDAHLREGDSLVVIGDGPMGQLAAAAGRALGAATVLMAGMTPHRLASAQGTFADRVVDISLEALRPAVLAATEQRGADVVLVTVSAGQALADGVSVVRPGGWVNAFAGVPEGTTIDLDVRALHYQQYNLTGSSGLAPVHMQKALDLLAEARIDFARVITARFPFERTAEAVAYVESRAGLKAMVTFPQRSSP